MGEERRMMTKRLTAFDSPIGWIGLLETGGVLELIKIGFTDQSSLVRAFAQFEIGPTRPSGERSRMQKRILCMLAGKADDLLDLKIETDHLTEFQKAVVDSCRRIPFGETLKYGELAAQVGRPKAARAVGTVMSKNRFPLVVPCHRVVSAGGAGGFTSPQGVTTKLTLQAIELGQTVAGAQAAVLKSPS